MLTVLLSLRQQTNEEMGADDGRSGDRFSKVQRLYSNCGLYELDEKDSPLFYLHTRGDSDRVRQDLRRHCLPPTGPPWSDHLWSGTQIYQRVLDASIRLAWYWCPVQNGFPFRVYFFSELKMKCPEETAPNDHNSDILSCKKMIESALIPKISDNIPTKWS